MQGTLAIIGLGNMGGAILSSILSRGLYPKENIMAADIDGAARQKAEAYGVGYTEDATGAADFGDIVILAVKPAMLQGVLASMPSATGDPEKLFISIAAGVGTQKLASYMDPASCRILRAMPNLALTVGEGMSAVCPGPGSVEGDIAAALSIFGASGKASVLSEDKIDAFVSIAASSPAMLAIILEAMADGGVKLGLSRSDSYRMAAQAMLGTAKLVLEGQLPAALKDAVCSPAGTSIEMTTVIENRAVRGAVIDAMAACWEKCRDLG